MQEENPRFFPADCASSSSRQRLESLTGREGKPVSAHDNLAGATRNPMHPASSRLRCKERLAAQLSAELRPGRPHLRSNQRRPSKSWRKSISVENAIKRLQRPEAIG